MQYQEDKVIRCIDIVLDRLGANARRTLILYMRRERGLKRHEILQNPSEFINALRSVLGRASMVIESEIIETLKSELNIEHKEHQDLLDCLIELQEKFDGEVQDDGKEEDTEEYRTYMDYTKNHKNVH